MLGYILGYIHMIIILYNITVIIYKKKKVDGELNIEEEKKKSETKRGLKNMFLNFPDDISILNNCVPSNEVATYVRHSG